MKKTLSFKKLVLFLLVFSLHFVSFGQSQKNQQLNNSSDRSKNVISTSKKVLGINRTTTTPANRLGGGSTTVITACNSYTWAANGTTYNTSGLYTTGGGVTQGFNNQTNWQNSVASNGATVTTNNLAGLPTGVNPTVVTLNGINVSMSAPGGMYSNGTFISSNLAEDALTITFSTPVYGFAANIFATDISDTVVTGDVTATYSTGFVDTRTVSSSTEYYGYTSTTPITSVVLTIVNTGAPFKWSTINNLSIATNPTPLVLDLTIENGPVTTPYTICQGGTVSGGLTSTLGGVVTPLPNYSGDTTGAPTFNRSTSMAQGGTCNNSGVGTAVRYVTHSFIAPITGSYTFSTCGGSTWDNFLSLYQDPFNPAGLCAGNNLVTASDDVCGAQAEATANLVGGTSYTLVMTGYGNTDFGTYTILSTTPSGPSVEWYTASTGGSAIAFGSPFNPVGVAGSGIVDTNTVAVTPFYAQFPGSTCRTETLFEITAPTTTPTFDAVAPICSGDVLTALPTTSTNGVTGTWSPALDNTTTITYTFTPDAGQCATTTTLEIVVNTTVAPTAIAGTAINVTMTDQCAFINGLYNDNGILNGKKTFVYSVDSNFNISFDGVKWVLWCCGDIAITGFENLTVPAGLYPPTTGWTPVAGTGCISGTLTIDLPTATFCDGATVADLTATGTDLQWYDVATGGTALAASTVLVTGPYYVTQTLNGCESTTTQVDVIVNPIVTPTFDAVAPICNGDALTALPTTSTNGVTGTWSPVIDNTTTTTYTFTPDAGQCATTATLEIIVNPIVTSTFDAVAPICNGDALTALPTTSTNGVIGTWSPALDNTTTTTYTFTPDAGQCATTATLEIIVNPIVIPTFTQVAPICAGDTLATLPTTSDNSITGTWSPAIDATVTTTYTFTPDAGQCATTASMTIVVNPIPALVFTANPFPICAGTSSVITANVTNVTPTISFTDLSAVNQNFSMNAAATFGIPVTSPLSGTLVNVLSNGCAPFPPGTLTGKIALIQRGTCAFTIKALNAQNAGAIGVVLYNNVAGNLNPGGVDPTITIPVYAVTQANGLALIAAMTGNELAVTLSPPAPVTHLWSTGETTASINTGVLNVDTVFSVTVTNTATGCSVNTGVTVPVTPNTIPTFNPVSAICNGDALAALPTTSTNGLAGTWSPALDNTVTTTYTFTPTPVAGQCLATAELTITVNQPSAPLFTQVAPICVGATLSALPTTSNDGITGTWSPIEDATVTTTYTFTPDAGQCATTTTMTIVVNPLPVLAFTANPFPICAVTSSVITANVTNATPTISFTDLSATSQNLSMNAAAFGVPVTSPFSGTLMVAPSNGCAAFTPGSMTGKIVLIQRGACAFTIKAINAQNAGAIGVVFYNNVAGNLIPGGVDPTITIPVYAVTQANGLAIIAATVANELPVTLNPAPTITHLWSTGETTPSINTGVLNVDTVFSVTVTNTVTGCSTSTSVNVPVTPNTIPTFDPVSAICTGDVLAALPTTSTNGLAGTWSPALDNTATTTYTFTPTPVAGQCLGTAELTITVNPVTSNTTTVTACDSYTWSVNGTTYTTSGMQTVVNGCATEILDLTINPTGVTPTGSAAQTLLNTDTLASIVVNPTTVIWYPTEADALAGTNALDPTTLVTDATTYYAVDATGLCPSLPLAITVTVTLANEQFDNLNFSYYPNPTSSVLNIKYSKEIKEVSVINLLGQLIMTKKTNNTEVQIDLSSLAQATYFVKVVSEGVEKTIKIIKE